MKIDGGCHCGALTYEAEVDVENVTVCHCTDCQKMSGTAFRTVGRAAEENFKLLSGTPKIYEKVAESGAGRAMAFCGNCGTQIYGKVYGIRLGTASQRDSLIPKRQIWGRSSMPWLSALGDVPGKEKD